MTPACERSGFLPPFCYTIEDDMRREFKQGTVFLSNCKEVTVAIARRWWEVRN